MNNDFFIIYVFSEYSFHYVYSCLTSYQHNAWTNSCPYNAVVGKTEYNRQERPRKRMNIHLSALGCIYDKFPTLSL